MMATDTASTAPPTAHGWGISLTTDRDWTQATTIEPLILARTRMDVALPEPDTRLLTFLNQKTDSLKLLELELFSTGPHDKPSATRADARAATLVRRLIPPVVPAKTRIALRPVPCHWLCVPQHAMRLVMRINHPLVGLSFDYGHWLSAGDDGLEVILGMLMPRLWNVVIPAEVQAKDRHMLMQVLCRHGYDGMRTNDPTVRQAAGAD